MIVSEPEPFANHSKQLRAVANNSERSGSRLIGIFHGLYSALLGYSWISRLGLVVRCFWDIES